MRLRSIGVAAFLVAAAAPRAGAHGGEDHEAPASVAVGIERRTAFGHSTSFELLLKHGPPDPSRPASLDVFLADYSTNRPIEGARIALEIAGLRADAEATARPGIYHAVLALAPGRHPVVATITAGPVAERVEIAQLDFAAATLGSHAHSHFPWLPVGAAAGAAVLLAAFVLVWRRRRRAAQLTTVLVLALVPLAARGHGDEDHGASAARPVQPATTPGAIFFAKESQFLLEVETTVVAERELEPRLETVGRIIPRSDGHAEIYAPQPGRLVAVGGRLPFIGDPVKAGQPLVVIAEAMGAAETGALRADAIRARADAAQARARRDQAKRNLDRLRGLAGVVSAKDVQQAELDLTLAERDVERSERESALLGGAGLARLTVTAPLAGIIAQADASAGEQVTTDRKLFTIVEPSTLWVEADVFEGDLGRVEERGSAQVRVQGYDFDFPAKLFRLGQLVDPTTRTTKAIFTVENRDGRLRPGMFAEVAIAAGAPQRELAVPDDALVEDGGRRFVFVHVTPEEFVRREVVLGTRDGAFWGVRRGLAPGDRVVTQGTYQLRTAR